MHVRRLSHAVAAVGAVLLAATLITPATGATSSAPIAYPEAKPVAGVTSADQMVEANGHLFVSSGPTGSDIWELSTSGAVISHLTGEPGADGMVVSPDGSTLFVALNNSSAPAISVVDTTSFAETDRYPVEACPRSVALAAGRLFYTYGCDPESGTGGVASIDPASGGTPVESLSGALGDILVRGYGSVLAVADVGDGLATYTADGSGGLTLIAKVAPADQPENVIEDMSFTPDGASVLTVAGAPYQITSYDAATMLPNGSYSGVEYPQAVAIAGSHVAAGFESYDSTVALYDQSSPTPRWQRFTTGTDPTTWAAGSSFDKVIPQTLLFSAAGTQLYGLVSRENLSGVYFFSSSLAPVTPKLKLSTSRVGLGNVHQAVATVTGVSSAPVTFTGTANHVTKKLATVQAGSGGVARMKFISTYSGTITASYAGSAAAYPGKVTSHFTVPSKTYAKLTGKHIMNHGVAFYTSYKKLNVIFHTTPPEASRATKTEFENRTNHGWHVFATLQFHEDAAGLRVFFIHAAPQHVELRVKLIVPADSLSGRSTATSRIFEFY